MWLIEIHQLFLFIWNLKFIGNLPDNSFFFSFKGFSWFQYVYIVRYRKKNFNLSLWLFCHFTNHIHLKLFISVLSFQRCLFSSVARNGFRMLFVKCCANIGYTHIFVLSFCCSVCSVIFFHPYSHTQTSYYMCVPIKMII